MHIGPSTQIYIARLCHTLAYGERLAQNCARRQAELTAEPKMRRFLLQQAQQENFHALIFQGAVAVLAPKQPVASPASDALQDYGKRLEADLETGKLAESLLGMQVVLEGLGSVVLEEIGIALSQHGSLFAPFRRLLQQEDTHHAFGLHALEQLRARDGVEAQQLQAAGRDYLELSDQALLACCELFQHFDSDPGDYSQSLRQQLPDWLKTARS